MNIVVYVRDAGTPEPPSHAKVVAIDSETAEAARFQLHAAVDTLVNDVKAGWTPGTANSAAELASAETAAAEAEQAYVAAQRRVDEARRRAGAAEAEAAAPEARATTVPPLAGAGETHKRGDLPEGFPGREALAEAGITTYGQARKAAERDLTQIPGIGDSTAEKIKADL